MPGWPEFKARPYVCGALGGYEARRLRRLRAAGPRVARAHSASGVVLYASDRLRPARGREGCLAFSFRGDSRDGSGSLPEAAGRNGLWLERAEETEAPGLIDDGDRVILHSGGLGLVDLYYATRGEAVYFASRIEPLLSVVEAPHEIDWAAWAGILRLACPLGEGTPFATVRRLGAATAVTWSRSTRTISTDRRLHRSIAADPQGGEATARELVDPD